jgi:hypothetical protein
MGMIVGIYIILFLVIFITYIIKKNNYDKSNYKKESGNKFFGVMMDKGKYGEYLSFNILEKINGASRILTNVYLPKGNGETTEIDLVYIHETGIYVLESKNYSGWIFGNGTHTQWTQVLAYGKEKYHFYNPIMQNNKHISALKNQTKQFKDLPFFSVVVFYGNCELRDISFVPNGTFVVKSNRVLEVMNIIMTTNKPARYTDKYEVVRVFREAVQNGENIEIQNHHIENIKDMLGRSRVFD